MRLHKLLALTAAALWMSISAPTYGAVLLNDNFDTEHGGTGILNYSAFANFNVSNGGTGGAVDLIGNGFFDFYPGNGLYVDICGSSAACGVLATKQTFPAGSYTVTLGIAGNARSPVVDALNVNFGPFSASFPLTEFQVATEVFNVTLSAPAVLSISDQGLLGPVIGDILLSARVETAAAAVPEPASLALLGASLVGLAVLRRRRRNLTQG